MFQQITRNIKIAVKTKYEGIVSHGKNPYHAFSYFITITNKSKETVQLVARYWNIYDSLNNSEFIEGKGVVGQSPILLPNSEYNYTSNCFLLSTVGSMSGNYKMVNLKTSEEFLVNIPNFQLITTPVLN